MRFQLCHKLEQFIFLKMAYCILQSDIWLLRYFNPPNLVANHRALSLIVKWVVSGR